MVDLFTNTYSRLFLIEDRAGPANAPEYIGFGRAGAPSWDGGDVTPVRQPADDQYGSFSVVGTIRGAQGLPSLPIMVRYNFELSDMLRLFRKRCPIDARVHMGKCRDPRDPNNGWDKIAVLEGAVLTNYGAGDLGAMEPGDEAVVIEEIPLTGLDYYEIIRIMPAELGESEIVQEIVDVLICDARQCGECGIASNGCLKLFAITRSAGGSPGLPAELIYSDDGGVTLGQTNISTLAANEDPSAAACVGTLLVVVSNASDSLHYATIADILLGTETWVEVLTGFVTPAGSPNDIFSAGALHTWIVGDAGYIYFTADPTAGVTVQDAGIATTQNLNAIHGIDNQNLVAVGALNAVVLTNNGGITWASVTGPAVGIALNTVWMRSKTEWYVGAANGRLYYTRDAGLNWTEKAFPGSGTGTVRDVVFATPLVGYMSHTTAATVGRILRTIDGGYSWYELPENQSQSFLDNDGIAALAACREDPNVVFGGGLAGDATDGFLVKCA